MLEKTFTPSNLEPRLYKMWESSDAFKGGLKPDAEPYSIVIPPPNVTGSLHMGHALNNTLQDILARFERMRGKDVLWQPGTDHAGIATQMVVERKLAADKKPTRREMGREAFLKEVWAWKEESGNIITNQLKRLGSSCDWSRERFTMDEGLSKAVLKIFVMLHKKGLIYKDKRLVNWDPKLLTAISDLEVIQTELKGKLYYFDYPLDDGSGHITIATTRPETMLGDAAIAVNPKDDRYKAIVDKLVRLPLTDRLIPIIADDYSDMEKGSGAVKITPAHDFNDFEVGKRHNLPQISILDKEAKIDLEGSPYHGLDRFVARKQIVAAMEALGLCSKIEEHIHMVPHGDRGGVPVEPYLTEQWYVDAHTLAQPALKAVREGKTRFVPETWAKTYFEWLDNIQPWCISRQLWWGHQIPAWYDENGKIYVAESEAEAQAEAGAGVSLTRDEDVLDTWFSSALWPYSTFGWPEQTETLKRFYPTSVLITGFDIIFFWVARMMMTGIFTQDDVPFKDVYIHALVRDEKGAKMSKSKGNVIDPLEIIDQYGADALRFTLAALAAQGRDIKLAPARVEGYRNFATKLWNAARFAEMNECVRVVGFNPATVKNTLSQWVIHEAVQTNAEITAALEAYRFNDAANAAYKFTWNIFCDWFLEFAKPVFNGSDEAVKLEVRATTAWVLDEIMKMLHPFMPFITEELWQTTNAGGMLITAPWSKHDIAYPEASQEIGWLVDIISEIRSIRTEMNIPAGAKIPLQLVNVSSDTQTRAKGFADLIAKLARIEGMTFVAEADKGAIAGLVRGESFALPLKGVVDLTAEKNRLAKEIGKIESDYDKINARLNNEAFVAKAPESVLDENRTKLEGFSEELMKLKAALAKVNEAG
jgi:valyl-tRNA synthetase